MAAEARVLRASNSLAAIAIMSRIMLPRTGRALMPPHVTRRDVTDIRADLYVPPGGPWPGIVLVLGALREGRRYPLLEKTARAIAACGFAVLVPELGRLQQLILAVDALDELVGSALKLPGLDGVVDGRIGLIGFSLGGSLALLAAGDARLHGRVACVASMGGYFRLIEMLTAATVDSATLATPSVFTVAASLAARLDDPDRQLLLQALDDHRESPLDAWSGIAAATVGPEAKTVIALIQNRDPDAVTSLVRNCRGLEAALDALSPKSALGRIEAPVWVLHDERDRYVPAEQFRRMRQAMAGDSNFTFLSIRLLEHTEPIPPTLNLLRLFGDYVPGMVRLTRFVRGPLAALRRQARSRQS